MNFDQKRKLEMELNSEPEISIGDTIIVPKFGIHATIAHIYYADRCVEWHDQKNEFVKYYDVEFKDTKGDYHHWKSYFDGGHIEYKNRQDMETRIHAIIFEHGNDDYGIWEGFHLSKEDEQAIQAILMKYETEGCSLRGTRKEIAEEFAE